MRLFVAFNLPEHDRDEIHDCCAPLRERDLPLRWIEPENYHVTLKFLGQVESDRVVGIEEALASASDSPPFDVTLSGFGAFPTIRRPRVLWLGVDAAPALRSLKQDLEWKLSDLDFERDGRTFHPHLTLARARPDGSAGAFRGLDETVASMDFECDVAVASLDLMRSVQTAEGPRYSVLSSIPLGAAD